MLLSTFANTYRPKTSFQTPRDSGFLSAILVRLISISRNKRTELYICITGEVKRETKPKKGTNSSANRLETRKKIGTKTKRFRYPAVAPPFLFQVPLYYYFPLSFSREEKKIIFRFFYPSNAGEATGSSFLFHFKPPTISFLSTHATSKKKAQQPPFFFIPFFRGPAPPPPSFIKTNGPTDRTDSRSSGGRRREESE